MRYSFIGENHPEADGKEPKDGVAAVDLTIPLESKGTLIVRLGMIGFLQHAGSILAMLEDNPDMKKVANRVKRKMLE